MLLRKEITMNNRASNLEDNVTELRYALMQLKKGKITIVLQVEEDSVTRAKKRYFAMIRDLAIHAGYQSKEDIDTFKEQIKAQLGNESIREMTDYEQIRIKIEELHKLASDHYDYRFKVYDKTDINFNPQPNQGA